MVKRASRKNRNNKRAKENKSLALSNNNIEPRDNNSVIIEKQLEIISMQRSAPLPPPGDMRAYQEIVPDLPERLLANLEHQTKHRTEMERIALRASINDTKRGQYCALTIACVFLFGALYCAHIGATVVACTIVGSTVTGIVSAFLYTQHSKSNNNKEKQKELPSPDQPLEDND